MNFGMALFSLITSIVLAVPAVAQSPVTVRKIAIELTGVDCAVVSQVFVIADGDDGAQLRAERDKPDGCRWSYENKDLDSDPYRLGVTRFSLRLRGARTRCRYAVQATDRKIGYLKFDYAAVDDDVVDLTITAVPSTFELTYSRKLPAGKHGKEYVECDEGDSVENGKAKLKDVWLSAETLDLQIAWTDKPGDARRVTLARYRDRIKAAVKKKRTTELTPDALGAADVEQSSRRKGDMAPNQGDKVAELLRKKGLKSVQVKAE